MKRFNVFFVALAFTSIWLIAIAGIATPRKIYTESGLQVSPVTDKAPLQAPSARALCTMVKHSGTASSFWSGYEANTGAFTYYDPVVECGPPAYPFEITDFSFTLYDPGGYVWPAMVDVVVYGLAPTNNICDGPRPEICRFSVTADQATFQYPNVGTVTFPSPCCVTGPFFIGLEYTAGTNGSTPSVLFDDNPAPDSCHNFQFDVSGVMVEWYDFWTPPVAGFPLFWVDGDTQSPNCGSGPCAWNPGDPHKMHYPQLPDTFGWDVNGTYPIQLADDWQCTETGWVKDFHWWGSWRNGAEGEILNFVLTIYEDIPAGTGGLPYSRPGALLWQQEIPGFPGDSYVSQSFEGWYDPETGEILYDNHQEYFQYNFCPDEPWFMQDSGTIYWLSVVALVAEDPVLSQWGWKSTLDHWNDDAVWSPFGEDNWVDIYEPGSGSAGPITNNFDIIMDPQGNFQGGDGSDAYGEGWYFYPQDGWWNVWFYDHPFDYQRFKTIHIEFDAFLLDPTTGGFLELAVNWSTDAWSLDQPPTDSGPPLPGTDEALYIGRATLLAEELFDGHYVFDYTIPNYNPEWVSIDVRGFNFAIPGGFITHDCVGDPVSLDLAFVITGEPPADEEGACCLPDGSCIQTIQTGCEALGGVWMGPGTACTALEACCLQDGTCIEADPLCCEFMGGVPQGPGTQCADAIEACCFSDGTCQNLDPLCCQSMGGVPQGAGVLCTQPEACCLPDGSCIMIDPACCDDLGGTPQGVGSQCSANTEACCFADGSCLDIDPLCCLDRGGVPQGPGSLCDSDGDGVDDACDEKTGACCLPDGSCVNGVTATDCQAAYAGTYMGDGSNCLGDNNGNGMDDLCEEPWQPGDDHKMHYPQLPDEAGWDVNASWPMVLADDWQCTETGWVKDIHFWGSWLDGNEDYGGIIDFTFSVHTDIPAGTGGLPYSQPGDLLWEHRIANFKATKLFPPTLEGYYDPFGGIVLPDNHQEYYQYDVYLPEDFWFWQDSGTIYWLNITANVENPTSPGRWGWKSSIEHFNDDAVWGFDDTPPIVAPDDGTGTVALPADGPYTSPNDKPWVATEGLPPDATIQFSASFDSFFDISYSPGGNLGGEIIRCSAILTLDVQGTGPISVLSRHLMPQVEIEMHTGPRLPSPGAPAQTIEIEIVELSLTGGGIFGDPDFDILKIEGGSNFGLPSPGHTTLSRLGPPGSDFQVDSFFDIEYRIEFVGAAGSVIGDMGGTTEGGPIRMQQGGADVNSWTEMYEPPNFDQSLDLAFVITGGKDQICDCIPGDANGDGSVNVGDAVYLIAYVFKGGPPPVPYPICSGDANCDCVVNVGDAVYIISYVFKGGPPPCDCLTWLSLCGPPLRK